jgi:hypothetical protein
MAIAVVLLAGCAHILETAKRSEICVLLCEASPEDDGEMCIALRDGDVCYCEYDDAVTRRTKMWTVPIRHELVASGTGR